MADVLIIGGGVIGMCSAYYTALRGHRVTLLERLPEQRDGCSFGNAGMVVPSHFVPLAAPGMVGQALRMMWNPESPFYLRPRLDRELLRWGREFIRSSTRQHVERSAPLLRDLHLASREAFRELADLPGHDFGLMERGLLMLCQTEHGVEEEAAAAACANQLGIPAEVLSPEETDRLDPRVRREIIGSIFYPRDCHLSPSRFMHALSGLLEEHGVRRQWNAEVTGWETRDSQIEAALTSQGSFSAEEYVLAGGAWSSRLAKDLGLRLPLQAGKGYSLTLEQPRQLPEICCMLTEARVAVTPMGNSLRFGGTMEIAGLDSTIRQRRVRGIVRSACRYFPEFQASDFAGITPWLGLRPCSPDGLPYLGRTARFQNLCMATGHAMMGLSLAPITGQLVSQIVGGEPTSHDLRLLSPDRFVH